MAMAAELAALVVDDKRLELLAPPETGMVVWRPVVVDATEKLHASLPPGSTSLTTLPSGRWLRNVAASPNLEISALGTAMKEGLQAV
jgi:L-2,4-diaminobutyrate decarboxylase